MSFSFANRILVFYKQLRRNGLQRYVLMDIASGNYIYLFAADWYWGNRKWLFPLAFGIMYMLAEYATFSAANMISFSKINAPEFSMILIGAIISAIGLGIGATINNLKVRAKGKRQYEKRRY